MDSLAGLLDRVAPRTDAVTIYRDQAGRWQANIRRGRTGNSYCVRIGTTPSKALEMALRGIVPAQASAAEDDDWKSLV